jgi:hypothetical protein
MYSILLATVLAERQIAFISHAEFNYFSSRQCFSSIIKNVRNSEASSCCCHTLFWPLRKCVLVRAEIISLLTVYQLEDFPRDAFECDVLSTCHQSH